MTLNFSVGEDFWEYHEQTRTNQSTDITKAPMTRLKLYFGQKLLSLEKTGKGGRKEKTTNNCV